MAWQITKPVTWWCVAGERLIHVSLPLQGSLTSLFSTSNKKKK
jgi:hypothetical protein